jgi:hypothetical protein
MNRIASIVVMLVACGQSPGPIAPTPSRSGPLSQAPARPVSPPKIASPDPQPAAPTATRTTTTPIDYADPQAGSRHATVKAKLVGIRDEMPMCGGIHFGSVVEYEVIAVETGSLSSLHVLAAVGCIQMPRASYDTNAGTLGKFQLGDVHRITISNDIADSRGMSVLATPSLYYLISADPG